VPAYAIDTLGIVRWQNAVSIRLVGDARGLRFTTVVAPQQALEARETFTRNILGAHGVKDARVELVQPDGRRVKVEICSAPLLDAIGSSGCSGSQPVCASRRRRGRSRI
jgi:hypothetical protein